MTELVSKIWTLSLFCVPDSKAACKTEKGEPVKS